MKEKRNHRDRLMTAMEEQLEGIERAIEILDRDWEKADPETQELIKEAREQLLELLPRSRRENK